MWGDKMYENATTVQFQPSQMDEALRILREDVVPVLKEQKGLISLCLLPDRSADKITVISLWISKAHALTIEANCAYRNEVKKLDPLLDSPFAYPEYKVNTLNQVRSHFLMN
jgi:quinol monooxygenase YgiN